LRDIIIALDIGGTSIKIGLIRLNGKILHKWQIKTDILNSGKNIVDDIWNSLIAYFGRYNVSWDSIFGIGVGVPGFVDNKSGIVYEAVNIGWKNYPIKELLERKTRIPIYVENDANLAALGENWLGAGGNAENLIMVTLGTGVGGGFIVNGEILNGGNGTAGEIGHVTIQKNDGFQCNCGRRGCLDTIASANGIVTSFSKYMLANPILAKKHNLNKLQEIQAKDIFMYAKEGDEICLHVVEKAMESLAYALAFSASVVNPSKIIIGGGVSNAGDFILEIIEKYFTKYVLPRISTYCELEISKLGNDAGLYGATQIVLKKEC
jgi:glucokinase